MTLRAGAMVGEIALLEGGQRTATVRATTPTEVLIFSKKKLMQLDPSTIQVIREIAMYNKVTALLPPHHLTPSPPVYLSLPHRPTSYTHLPPTFPSPHIPHLRKVHRLDRLHPPLFKKSPSFSSLLSSLLPSPLYLLASLPALPPCLSLSPRVASFLFRRAQETPLRELIKTSPFSKSAPLSYSTRCPLHPSCSGSCYV